MVKANSAETERAKEFEPTIPKRVGAIHARVQPRISPLPFSAALKYRVLPCVTFRPPSHMNVTTARTLLFTPSIRNGHSERIGGWSGSCGHRGLTKPEPAALVECDR